MKKTTWHRFGLSPEVSRQGDRRAEGIGGRGGFATAITASSTGRARRARFARTRPIC